MEHELNDIKNLWQQAKQHQPLVLTSAEELITQARLKTRKIYYEHFGNIIMLGSTLALLILFFLHLYSLQDLLTKIGITLMIGGLLVRMGIEIISLIRARKIHISYPTARTLPTLLAFHRLRKQIHGPITIIIVILYIMGLYAVTPEVGRHISNESFLLMHTSIPLLAIFLVVVGRWGINKEMKELNRLLEIQQKLTDQN